MIACIDVDYADQSGQPTRARAACVVFADWSSASATAEYVEHIEDVAAYVPGRFFERELPCALAVLARVEQPLDVLIIDGYVWLGQGRVGLGGHLYEALGRALPIIGVAKHEFHDNDAAIAVLRGTSARPLYVTALGLDPEVAAADIRRMHGPHRLPTMLKRVDRLCRDGR